MDANHLKLDEKYLCLDFINTLEWRLRDHPQEKLKSYADLLNWACEINLIDALEAQALREKAGLFPAEAGRAVERALALREAAFAVLQAGMEGRPAPETELSRLNDFVASALARARLAQTPDGFGLGWPDDRQELDWFLRPVAGSVVEVLTTADLERVKICASEQGCGWRFYDTSRNKSRRWCSMQSCGNRAKATSYYHRHAADRE
jgi:predicted RNA-binding Zn ribbon-like protein